MTFIISLKVVKREINLTHIEMVFKYKCPYIIILKQVFYNNEYPVTNHTDTNCKQYISY